MPSSRFVSRRLALLAAAAALTLAACGDATRQEKTSSTAGAATQKTTAGGATAPAPLKVAFAYNGPLGDGGWTMAHENARRLLAEKFGSRIQTSFIEKIDTDDQAEKAFKDMAASGASLIFGTSFVHLNAMRQAASSMPNVRFENATGNITTPNMSTYDSRTYEGAYMAGVIAASMSKTQVLGVVASIPIPEVRRNINSFTLGAQSINPAIKTRVIWVNTWYDPAREADATTKLIQSGADILLQNTDSSAVLQTIERLGKRGFGWNSNMAAYGPKAHLGSVAIDWTPYYTKTIQDMLDGKWQSSSSWWGVREGAISLVELAADVPASSKAQVLEIEGGLKNGTFHVWKGPVQNQAGQTVLERDQVASDDFLKNIDFLVRGVEEIGSL